LVHRSRWRRKTSAGPPANLVTRALTRRATRSRTGIHKMSVFDSPRGGSSSRRAGVTNGCAIRETVGLQPLPLGSGERASALRTTRRNASRSCFMRPNPPRGVGARFSQVGLAGHRRKPMLGAGSCRLAIGPEEGGACENDMGRERSDSTERGSTSRTHVWARGVGTGAKSSTGSERSSNTFHGAVPR
jgi:hypothetical protein